MNVPSDSAPRKPSNAGKAGKVRKAAPAAPAGAVGGELARKPATRRSAVATAGARLHEVEVKLSFVDDLVDSLNRTVYRQQQQIDQLAQALQSLRRQVQSGAAVAGGDPREELPPHY